MPLRLGRKGHKESETVDKIMSIFESRRFWAAVAGVMVVVLHDTLGLDETSAQAIAALVVSWIVGDSLRRTGGFK